jgi:endonuclease-3
MTRGERALLVLKRLKKTYPDAHCALDHRDAYELTAATILSAQCTDERVNLVTPHLFRKYPNPKRLAGAKQEDVEAIVQSTGFFRNKARNLIGMAQTVVEDFGGKIPRTMDELLTLPGVARKTANVVLGNAFGINEGVVVDTHVGRLAKRIGLTSHDDPKKVEKDLMRHFPRDDWALLSHLLIWHGRGTCAARWPDCGNCVLGEDACRSFEPDMERWKKRAARKGKRKAPTR